MNYRKLWMQKNGPIPLDKQGRSYEIHHIDGNRKNNCLENLLCLSIEDHYKLHYDKGEYFAANLIAQRMDKPAEPIKKWDISESRRAALRESKLGDKNPMKDPAVRKKVSEALKGRKKSPESEAKRLKSREGFRHSEETKQKMKKPKYKLKCPHCSLEGGSSQMKRWHFENCKNKI